MAVIHQYQRKKTRNYTETCKRCGKQEKLDIKPTTDVFLCVDCDDRKRNVISDSQAEKCAAHAYRYKSEFITDSAERGAKLLMKLDIYTLRAITADPFVTKEKISFFFNLEDRLS